MREARLWRRTQVCCCRILVAVPGTPKWERMGHDRVNDDGTRRVVVELTLSSWLPLPRPLAICSLVLICRAWRWPWWSAVLQSAADDGHATANGDGGVQRQWLARQRCEAANRILSRWVRGKLVNVELTGKAKNGYSTS